MNNYTITFTFRGREVYGKVHDHGLFKSVWFTDREVINDFGRRITFNPDGSVDNLKDDATDYRDFISLVKSKLH